MKKSAAACVYIQVPAAVVTAAASAVIGIKKSVHGAKRLREVHGKPVLVHKTTEPKPIELEQSEETDTEKQLETLKQLSQTSKNARRDRVVLEHLALVRAIAVRVHENLPVHVDLDDLVHAGILGLFDAASKFDPDKQVVFSSYAKHRIKGAILDSLRQLDWASRDLRRRHKQVEAVTRELASELQRNPTEAEIADKLGVAVDRWRQMMLDLRNVGLISASTRTNDQDDLPAPDFPSKPETQPDNMCAREQLRSALGVAMKTLPERYQKVVLLYYTNEMTMKEIGGVLGINESRVSQIHKSALEKMQVVLQSNGISGIEAF
jgi:RNA polymerase sigma factor for flagellar operon FliA